MWMGWEHTALVEPCLKLQKKMEEKNTHQVSLIIALLSPKLPFPCSFGNILCSAAFTMYTVLKGNRFLCGFTL